MKKAICILFLLLYSRTESTPRNMERLSGSKPAFAAYPHSDRREIAGLFSVPVFHSPVDNAGTVALLTPCGKGKEADIGAAAQTETGATRNGTSLLP